MKALKYILTMMTAVAFLAGCQSSGSRRSEAAGSNSSLVILAVDYSKSTENIRLQLLGESHEIATDVENSDLRVFRFGHSIEEVYSGKVEDEDAFALILKSLTESDPVLGTQYPKMLSTLADTIKETKAKEVRIIIAGDGYNDFRDRRNEALYQAAAKTLAAYPKVVFVRYWGVQVGAREEIRSLFHGQPKLQLMSLDQDPLEP